LKIVTASQLRNLTSAAGARERLRDNLNIHSSLDDAIQRLVIAFEPGSYVRPHCHRAAPKWELMTRLSGAAIMLTFDDSGMVLRRLVVDSETPIVEVPANTWHTLAALETGTAMLEVKPGPYVPLASGDFATWAPPEGSSDVPAFVAWIQQAGIGDRFGSL